MTKDVRTRLVELLDDPTPLESPDRPRGRTVEAVGLTLRAHIDGARIGDLCRVDRGGRELLAEVVGFGGDTVTLMSYGDLDGVGPGTPIALLDGPGSLPVGPELLGRVLDGMGRQLDDRPAPRCAERRSLAAEPPAPLARSRIERSLPTGIRTIDTFLACGEGQRLGLFAGPGVGKSTLLGMIARNTAADVNVIALVGERGKEVREFLEDSLGPDGLTRSVVVVSTSDRPAIERVRGAQIATAVAEYFRDRGLRVMLLFDSITRYARALRDVGLAAGEAPVRQGYPSSVFSALPRLLERAGTNERGSITAFYTVLVDGDDLTETISSESMSILDGHVVLSRDVAHRERRPAIDVLGSASRAAAHVWTAEQRTLVKRTRELHALFEANRVAIELGAYEGGNADLDRAVRLEPAIESFLRQDPHEHIVPEDSWSRMAEIVRLADAEPRP